MKIFARGVSIAQRGTALQECLVSEVKSHSKGCIFPLRQYKVTSLKQECTFYSCYKYLLKDLDSTDSIIF